MALLGLRCCFAALDGSEESRLVKETSKLLREERILAMQTDRMKIEQAMDRLI